MAQHAGSVAEDLNNKAEPTTGKQSDIAPNTPLRFAYYLTICVLHKPVVA